jgi:uncharacterized MAPEG superfamily protein
MEDAMLQSSIPLVATPLTPELMFLAWSVVLGLIYIILPVAIATRVNGMAWNAGPRDAPAKPSPPIGQRLQRAQANFLETYPLFLGALLIAVARHQSNHWITWGAEAYVWGRLLYIPLYAFGIAYVRSLAWAVATAGIFLILYGAAFT